MAERSGWDRKRSRPDPKGGARRIGGVVLSVRTIFCEMIADVRVFSELYDGVVHALIRNLMVRLLLFGECQGYAWIFHRQALVF